MEDPQAIIADPLKNYPPATVACFDPTTGPLPRRFLDRDRMRQFLSRLDRAGADGLLIGASTGHGHLRTPEELTEWLASAGEAKRHRARLMGLLRPEDGTSHLERHCEVMRDAGYCVGFVRPGTNLNASASAATIADNMLPAVRALGRAGLAIGLYSIPDVSGVAMPVESVTRILDSEHGAQVVAIKVTEADYEQSTLRFLEAPELKHIKIVQGWDPHLARALQDGGERVGVTSGPMSFAIEQYVHLLAAASKGDWKEVQSSQAAVTELFESMQDDPTRFADLQRAKAIMGLGHPLTSTVTDEQMARVMGRLRGIGRDEDRRRLARSLDLMEDGPFHDELASIAG